MRRPGPGRAGTGGPPGQSLRVRVSQSMMTGYASGSLVTAQWPVPGMRSTGCRGGREDQRVVLGHVDVVGPVDTSIGVLVSWSNRGRSEKALRRSESSSAWAAGRSRGRCRRCRPCRRRRCVRGRRRLRWGRRRDGGVHGAGEAGAGGVVAAHGEPEVHDLSAARPRASVMRPRRSRCRRRGSWGCGWSLRTGQVEGDDAGAGLQGEADEQGVQVHLPAVHAAAGDGTGASAGRSGAARMCTGTWVEPPWCGSVRMRREKSTGKPAAASWYSSAWRARAGAWARWPGLGNLAYP